MSFSHDMIPRFGVTFGEIFNEIRSFLCPWWTFKKMRKKTIYFRCHTAWHLKSSRTSHFSEQKVRCTCLRRLRASIGTIAIFLRSSGSSSVRYTDSIAGQRVSVVLAERLQPGVVVHSRCHTALHLKFFPQVTSVCKKKQVYVLEDASSFHWRHQHFHKKLRQELSPLHVLDSRSGTVPGVLAERQRLA